MAEQFRIEWIDGNREPQCAPNPRYPDGIDIDLARGVDGFRACKVDLPHPAKRCGLYHVTCTACGFSAAITTAGRPDDPRSVRLPCKGTQQ